MDFSKGFQLEVPAVFIPWGIRAADLEAPFGGSLERVRDGYYCMTCESLGGMQNELGLHFSYYSAIGTLHKLEFFRKDYSDIQGSYETFQKHFEDAFGPPDFREPGQQDGLPDCAWHLGDVTIVHYVFDRFGLEEHMEITKRHKSFLGQALHQIWEKITFGVGATRP